MQNKLNFLALFLTICLIGSLAVPFFISKYIDSISKNRILNPESVPASQACIIPGAKVWGQQVSHMLEDRLKCAIELHERGKCEKILVSGDHGQKDYDEVKAMAKYLIDNNVNQSVIFMDHAGFRTLDTLIRAKEVFQIGSATICTQEFHLPRSIFIGLKNNIEIFGVIADQRKYRSMPKNHIREFLAKNKAFLDFYILKKKPRFLGNTIPITGRSNFEIEK